MTIPRRTCLSLLVAALCSATEFTPLQAQTFAVPDPVLERIWAEAMENSHLEQLAHSLLDSIGPRLTASPGMDRAQEWAAAMLTSWGIEAENEAYGTWQGWERGFTHIDLIEPRLRTLEGMTLAWSPGTNGPITAEVAVVPAWRTEADLQGWIDTEARGRFILVDVPQLTCRPNAHYEEWGSQGALERLNEERTAATEAFRARVPTGGAFQQRLEAAGAAGILRSNWIQQIGVNRVFDSATRDIPSLDLSCEDYGLLYRLAEGGSAPVIRVNAEARALGQVPVHNTIGIIRGTELPDETIILSAHYDSWDGSSGATDNGTGSIVMLEAMRILAEVYPNPRRTILIGLWGGEEQGLNGSRRFAAMHPELVDNLQALFNQDNGTGRVVNVSMQGLVDASAHWGRWMARLPAQLSGQINLGIPGSPSSGGSDNASFICAGAPAFGLGALSWGYNPYTWHTNRDTYDKIVFEDVRGNAALVAMLAYLASEDPERVARTQRTMPGNQEWPTCAPGAATGGR